jgi:predicted Rossmann fold flavoprotein
MERREIIVIGGGAAGIMASISAARSGAKVTLVEKMERLGRKLRITGKGRCNITNTKPWREFSTHIHPKNNFFKHSFYSFSNTDTISLFDSIGLTTIVERGDRVFPASGLASDVVTSLQEELSRLNVEVLLNSMVIDIVTESESVSEVLIEDRLSGVRRGFKPEAVIIATGGLSYPLTGSDGDGHRIAQRLGHKIVECHPSLTALMPENYNTALEGLQLKNTEISLWVGKDLIQQEMGDLDFTNNGIEGSIGYKISRKAVKCLINGNRCSVSLDLKPAVDPYLLKERIKREVQQLNVKSLRYLLKKLLPSQAVEPFFSSLNLKNDSLKLSQDETIDILVTSLKCWKMEIVSFTSYERAVITAGGISLDEIVSKNMKSRMLSNLFFAGEIIDLDGDTGGYNLQIAFSTGYTAGREAASLILKKTELP